MIGRPARRGARLGHVMRRAVGLAAGTGQRVSRPMTTRPADGAKSSNAVSSGRPGGPRRPGPATGREAASAPEPRGDSAGQATVRRPA